LKVTDPEAIKKGENEFIDTLIAELDWQVIETLLKEKYRLKLHDDVEYKKGDIIVHGKAIAYKLDFDVRVTLSLVVGRDGECVEIRATGSGADGEDDDEFPRDDREKERVDKTVDDEESPARQRLDLSEHLKKKEQMASHLASIIDEINS
jgi:hypothetical protein